MAKVKGAIVVDTERCKGCGVCLATCPQACITLAKGVNGKGYHFMEQISDACTGCMNCAIVCPDGVITVYRAKSE